MKTAYVTTRDDVKIYFDHYQQGHDKVVILAHGFFNSKQAVLFKSMAADLLDEYDVIVMDFRGHGQSKGLFTWTAKEEADLKAVLDYARLSYARVGVIGFSLGAAVTLITAAQKQSLIDSVIAVSPPTQFGRIDGRFWTMGIEENIIYNFFQNGRIGKGVRPHHLWMKKTAPIDVVEKVEVPTLLIHGDKDWLIRPWHSRALYQKASLNNMHLEIIEGGTHAEYLYRTFPTRTMGLFKDWLRETL